MAEQDEQTAPITPAGTGDNDELTEAVLDEIAGGIGGTNGVARSGSGGITPPPTAPPQTF